MLGIQKTNLDLPFGFFMENFLIKIQVLIANAHLPSPQ